MTTAPRPFSPQHPFQFRIATLLFAMVWAGLLSFSLRSPTSLWSDTIAVLTLLVMLTAILIAIYRRERKRAMAVGFLVFSVGFLAYLAILAGTLNSGVHDADTPTGDAFNWLYTVVHPPSFNPNGPGGMPFPRGIQLRSDPFTRNEFIAICNNTLACLLGIAGGVLAQILYTTRGDEPKPNRQ